MHETIKTWGHTYQQEQWESEWSRAEPSRCQDKHSSCVRPQNNHSAHTAHTTHWAHAEIPIMFCNVCQIQIMFNYSIGKEYLWLFVKHCLIVVKSVDMQDEAKNVSEHFKMLINYHLKLWILGNFIKSRSILGLYMSAFVVAFCILRLV